MKAMVSLVNADLVENNKIHEGVFQQNRNRSLTRLPTPETIVKIVILLKNPSI
jgi:hypothetical protein